MLKRVATIPVFIASAALFALMVMTFADVTLRSAFNAPIEAATELTRIFMAVIVFSVMPAATATGQHISVDLTDGIFERLNLSRWRDGVIYLLCGVMMFWPLQRVWILAERLRDYGDVTQYLAIPQFYIGWFIAASVALSALALILAGLAHLFYPKLLEAGE